MKIKAPFSFHSVPVKIATGQAAGDKWYLAPFCLWSRRVYTGQTNCFGSLLTRVKVSWDYARPGQYLGTMSEHSGKSYWRPW